MNINNNTINNNTQNNLNDNNNIRHSTIHPKYLQSNSTSHKWPFGAIAELADNSLDANANLFSVDIEIYNENKYALIFTDNGSGMAPIEVHKMLSFGHCSKTDSISDSGEPYIGRYGNGFKSGEFYKYN
jgi:DNA gyrase/topoisomerase IV subunit B